MKGSMCLTAVANAMVTRKVKLQQHTRKCTSTFDRFLQFFLPNGARRETCLRLSSSPFTITTPQPIALPHAPV